jgi:hypothetical protein
MKTLKSTGGSPGSTVDGDVALVAQGQPAFGLIAGADVMGDDGGTGPAAFAGAAGAMHDLLAKPVLGAAVTA